MSASRMSARALTRLPVPHLIMVLALGIFALMAVLAFAPAMAADGDDPAATGLRPDAGEVLAADSVMPVVSTARAGGSPVAPTSNVLAFVSLGVLLGLLLATFRAGRMQAHGAGRPVLGLVAGLLAGVSAATGLCSLGVLPLRSPMWIYLPLVFSTLGTALGVTAPFQRTVGRGLRRCST